MEGFPEIEPFRRRFEEIDALMVTPGFFNDQRTSVDLSREHQKLSMLLDAHAHLLRLEGEIGEHRSIISDSESDEDLADLAREELPELEKRLDEIRQEALVSMLPSGADDGRNTIVEIRAGAGGDEASLFAADLYRMYTRYAETNGWKVEHLGSSESESGGFKQVVCLISGDDVYRSLKFESGVHRVQRVPVTVRQVCCSIHRRQTLRTRLSGRPVMTRASRPSFVTVVLRLGPLRSWRHGARFMTTSSSTRWSSM